MELAIARHRSLFKHPFGTAHGMRDGTDVVFVRLTRNGQHGYGEAALPPYLEYRQDDVIQAIRSFNLNSIRNQSPTSWALYLTEALPPPARAAFHTAHTMLICKEMELPCETILNSLDSSPRSARTMVTLGHSVIAEIPLKLKELPRSSVLKVKLGSPDDLVTIQKIKELDDRPLFLDTNQGWKSIEQALDTIATVGPERIAGLEQPFPKERWDLHGELKKLVPVPIYADESIQGIEDLQAAAEYFDGVNLKLMKCGGLDRAVEMIEVARRAGLKVMLGSMSETSLGCGAMACLTDFADLVDLDGPWLITNDPFAGLEMKEGELHKAKLPGMGIELRPDAMLDWSPIGA